MPNKTEVVLTLVGTIGGRLCYVEHLRDDNVPPENENPSALYLAPDLFANGETAPDSLTIYIPRRA